MGRLLTKEAGIWSRPSSLVANWNIAFDLQTIYLKNIMRSMMHESFLVFDSLAWNPESALSFPSNLRVYEPKFASFVVRLMPHFNDPKRKQKLPPVAG